MSDFPQSDRDLSEIARRRELPPDEPYAHGDDGDIPEHDCNADTRLVRVYEERRIVCNVCDAIVGLNLHAEGGPT